MLQEKICENRERLTEEEILELLKHDFIPEESENISKNTQTKAMRVMEITVRIFPSAGRIVKYVSQNLNQGYQSLAGVALTDQDIKESFRELLASPFPEKTLDSIASIYLSSANFYKEPDFAPIKQKQEHLYRAMHSKAIVQYLCHGLFHVYRAEDQIRDRYNFFNNFGEELYTKNRHYTLSRDSINATDFDREFIKQTMKLLGILGITQNIKKIETLKEFAQLILDEIFTLRTDFTDEESFWKKFNLIKYYILSIVYDESELTNIMREELTFRAKKTVETLIKDYSLAINETKQKHSQDESSLSPEELKEIMQYKL